MTPARPRTAFAPGAAPVPGRRRRARLFLHETGRLLQVSGPIIVSQLGMTAMSTTDTLMVGPLGADALAAAGLASSLHIATLVLCTGMLFGMGPLVSQAFGAGDRGECRSLMVQGLWLAAALSVPLTLVTVAGEPLALLLGQEPALAELIGAYMRALAPGLLPFLLFTAFRQYLEGMGIARPAMVVTFVGVLLNILGNWLLIWGVPGLVAPMGVVGSGAATSLVRWWMFAAMAVYVFRHAGLRAARRVARRPERARLGRIARLGGPIAAQYGAEVGVFATAAVMMGWLGRAQLAAHQVTINIASTTFMVALGTSYAGAIRVGQHVGARNLRGVHRASAATYLLVLAFMGLCALAFLLAPRFLIGLYTKDPAVLEFGTTLLLLAAAFQLFDGGQVAGVMVLRGAADTRIPMLITILGYWAVGFPVAWWLGFRTPMAHAGIWTGLVVALGVVALLLGWRVRRVVWGARPLVPVARDRAEEEALAATAV